MAASTEVYVDKRPWSTEANPSYQAFRILHFGFAVLATVVGVDKFTRLLHDWTAYLSPAFAAASPLTRQGTMYAVGLVEIAAGFLVAVVPRIGAYVVAAWLGLIILNLMLLGNAWDIALRDLGLLLAALALGKLSHLHKAPY